MAAIFYSLQYIRGRGAPGSEGGLSLAGVNFVHVSQFCLGVFVLAKDIAPFGQTRFVWGSRVEGLISRERWSFPPRSPVPPHHGFISVNVETISALDC